MRIEEAILNIVGFGNAFALVRGYVDVPFVIADLEIRYLLSWWRS